MTRSNMSVQGWNALWLKLEHRDCFPMREAERAGAGSISPSPRMDLNGPVHLDPSIGSYIFPAPFLPEFTRATVDTCYFIQIPHYLVIV